MNGTPRRSRLLPLLAAILLASLAALPATAAASTPAGGRVTGTLAQLIDRLPVRSEVRSGYDRDLFDHWEDLDRDGCDTREEVLIAESTVTPRTGSGCSVTYGRWRSVYDGVVTMNDSSFDVDHVIPLAEAWDSGARSWSSGRREAFANDLGDRRALRAVTASSNRSKGDQDPAEWLPPLTSFRCTYIRDWVALKVRWGLSVDSRERTVLRGFISRCGSAPISVNRA